jgi:uncharacterized protein YbaR (Trm112 family)
MNPKVLEILVSPISKTPLVYKKERQELWSHADKLAFPIRAGIPIMLVEEARHLSADELASMR